MNNSCNSSPIKVHCVRSKPHKFIKWPTELIQIPNVGDLVSSCKAKDFIQATYKVKEITHNADLSVTLDLG